MNTFFFCKKKIEKEFLDRIDFLIEVVTWLLPSRGIF